MQNITGIPKINLDTDVTLAANSDLLAPSQKAVKAYIAAQGSSKIIRITRAMNAGAGTVSYTGVGFRPKQAEFKAQLSGGSMSWGSDNGIQAMRISYIYTAGGLLTDTYDSATSIGLYTVGGAQGQIAKVTAWNADGFDLTWQTAAPGAGTADIFVTLN